MLALGVRNQGPDQQQVGQLHAVVVGQMRAPSFRRTWLPDSSAEEADCSDLEHAKAVVSRAICPQCRNNREVGTIGVVPTSEQRRIRAAARSRGDALVNSLNGGSVSRRDVPPTTPPRDTTVGSGRRASSLRLPVTTRSHRLRSRLRRIAAGLLGAGCVRCRRRWFGGCTCRRTWSCRRSGRGGQHRWRHLRA